MSSAMVPAAPRAASSPPDALDTPLTREALARVGLRAPAPPRSRSFRAAYSPRRLLAETMRFFAEESCQKCTPCRIGNRALHLAEDLQHDARR